MSNKIKNIIPHIGISELISGNYYVVNVHDKFLPLIKVVFENDFKDMPTELKQNVISAIISEVVDYYQEKK